MRMHLGFDTALEHWRRFDNLPPWGIALLTEADEQAFPSCGKKTSSRINRCETSRLAYLDLLSRYEQPLHIMVDRSVARRCPDSLAPHYSESTLPRGSYIEVSKDLFIASPELTFVQMASKIEAGKLAAIGYELCGRYSIQAASQRGFTERLPITTPRRIASFAERATRVAGAPMARSLARHLLANSASPAETQIAALLTLPKNKGGFGLPKPLLNMPLEVRGEAARLTHKHKLIGDAVWPDKKLIVEYDGKQDHLGPAKLAEDVERRDALRAMGYSVIVVTARQLYNAEAFREITKMIASELGWRIRITTQDFDSKHQQLRNELLSNTRQ